LGRRIEVPADAVEDLDELQRMLRRRMDHESADAIVAQACACGAGSLWLLRVTSHSFDSRQGGRGSVRPALLRPKCLRAVLW
jgi:hypothetical protein